MKIKFKKNNLVEKNICLNNVFLSEKNPRYTLLNSFDNLTNFIIGNKEKSEEQIFLDLLMTEGDFSDLESLLSSILSFGFQNINEPIYLVKNNLDYYVAEGNRRIMCLKLINGNFELPNFNDLIKTNNKYENVISNYVEENEEETNKNDFFEKKKSNYLKCEKLVKKIIDKNIDYEVHIKIIEDSNELWKMIYDKHLTGERPGMRKWSRSKSFADLLNLFPDGISLKNEDQKKKAWLLLNRDLKILARDFKEAQFIYSILFFTENYNKNKEYVDNFLNQEILNKMIYLESPSSLERNHSFNKIRNYICQDILHINKDEFAQDYISITFDKDRNRLYYVYNKIRPSVMSKFIFEQYKNNIINTRDIKNKNKFLNDIKFRLLNNIDEKNKLTLEQLENINEFEINLETLENIYNINSIYHSKENLKHLELAINLRKENQKFLKTIKSKVSRFNIEQPIKIFELFYEQLKWNMSEEHNKFFLNAAACSIRSFIEQIVVWMYWYIIEDNQAKEQYLNDIIENRINKIFHNIIDKNKNSEYIFNDLIKKNMIERVLFDKNKIQIFICKFDYIIDKNHNKILNEFIHSSHRIYFKTVFESHLENLTKIIEYLEFLIDLIDFEKFYKLNEILINSLKNK